MTNIVTATLGEDVDNELFVYIDAEGMVYKASNSDFEKQATGYVKTGGLLGEPVQVHLDGEVPAMIEGVSGNRVYLSDTDGLATMTKPNSPQSLGRMSDGAVMLLEIERKKVEITAAAAFFEL